MIKRQGGRTWRNFSIDSRCPGCRRTIHRLSRWFIPSGNITLSTLDRNGGYGHELLLKAGFVRQTSSGIFTMLPMGQRTLEKLTLRIDGFMQDGLGANRVSLPILAPKSIWEESGRWSSSGPELFKLENRKGGEYCLSPTHEECITKLVAAEVNGYRQFPIRLYQIGSKFRDEMRPRGGLLRGKEFIMKDLYTFDDGIEAAHETYAQVLETYRRFFRSLEVPHLVAEADSGNIGGDKSHEFHLPSKMGEDTLLRCSDCDYVANQELARSRYDRILAAAAAAEAEASSGPVMVRHRFAHQIFRDSVFFDLDLPVGRSPNLLQVTRAIRAIDPSVTTPIKLGYEITDHKNPSATIHPIINPTSSTKDASSLVTILERDPCPSCETGTLEAVQSIEVGHTFHLGTKYSDLMGFKYSTRENQSVHPEMGCHGLGVTRLIAALAQIRHDEHGLNWPAGLAPFETVLVCERGLEPVAESICTTLGKGVIDAVDDRAGKSLAYRVKDLHLMGIPRVLAIGKRFWLNNRDIFKSNCASEINESNVGMLKIDVIEGRGDAQKEWKLRTVQEWQATL